MPPGGIGPEPQRIDLAKCSLVGLAAAYNRAATGSTKPLRSPLRCLLALGALKLEYVAPDARTGWVENRPRAVRFPLVTASYGTESGLFRKKTLLQKSFPPETSFQKTPIRCGEAVSSDTFGFPHTRGTSATDDGREGPGR